MHFSQIDKYFKILEFFFYGFSIILDILLHCVIFLKTL